MSTIPLLESATPNDLGSGTFHFSNQRAPTRVVAARLIMASEALAIDAAVRRTFRANTAHQ
jgi:hypothetical protein